MGSDSSKEKSSPGGKPADFATNDHSKKGTPIYLNVYDLQDTTQGGRRKKSSTLNSSMGFGFHHSGVEVNGLEWSFGGHPDAHPAQCGIFPVRPRTALPAHQFNKQVLLGEIVGLTQPDVIAALRSIEKDWMARSYHVLNHNCNSFGEAFLEALSKKYNVNPPLKAPSWVNRAARFGDVVVPERIYKAMMRRAPQPPEGSFDTYAPPSSGPPPPSSHAPPPAQASSSPDETGIPLATAEQMSKMSVREIKTMMWVNGISWDGCLEKGDLIEAVEKFRKETEVD